VSENSGLYNLSARKLIASLSRFFSSTDEYCVAFEDRAAPTFLNYYSFQGRESNNRTLTKGEFWDLTFSAAAHLTE
jgi:hypothetical protein